MDRQVSTASEQAAPKDGQARALVHEPRQPRAYLLVDDHHGQYIAQVLAERYGDVLTDREPGERWPNSKPKSPQSWRLYSAIRRAKAGPEGSWRDPHGDGYIEAWDYLAGFAWYGSGDIYVVADDGVRWRLTTSEEGMFFAVHPDDLALFHGDDEGDGD